MYDEKHLQNVLDHFVSGTHIDGFKTLKGGAINGTYLASTNVGDYIIQSANPSVFGGHLDGIDHNYRSFAEALEKTRTEEGITLAVPEWIPDEAGRYIWIDTGDTIRKEVDDATRSETVDTAWRIYPYIEDGELDLDSDPNAIKIFAGALADMHRILKYYPDKPETVIPDYHRIDLYYEECENVVCRNDRDAYCEDLIRSNMNFILDNCVFDAETTIHGDTKIQNILYDRKSGTVSFIDMDTFMTSSSLIDVADSIRSILCRGDDDAEPVPEALSGSDAEALSGHYTEAPIDIASMQTFIKEYYRALGRAPSEDEQNQLVLAVLRMPFELALRFYTDYLRGNTYFHVKHNEQNLIRAKKQFDIFRQLLVAYNSMELRMSVL